MAKNEVNEVNEVKEAVQEQASNRIVLAEGTDREYTKILKIPKGREARQKLPMLLEFMNKIQELGGDEGEDAAQDFGRISKMVSTTWGFDQFEEELLPFALQMTSNKERKLLEEEFTLFEILQAFMQAAQYNIFSSISGEEVELALKKSKEEA